VEEKWSSRRIFQEVTPTAPKALLREVSQTTVEQRFEKRVMDAAKTMYSLLTLPQENYEDVIATLAAKAKDPKMRQALQSLRQTLEEILLRVEDLAASKVVEVALLAVIPPLEGLKRHLPADKADLLEAEVATGGQILDQLLEWRQGDPILASRLEPFFSQIEFDAESLRAGDPMALPVLIGEKRPEYSELVVYRLQSGASIYWAHELLVKRGDVRFKKMKAELVSIAYLDEEDTEM
jgi:hypothetical protein